MKPLRLTLEGIGPFLTTTIVDLDVPSPLAIVAESGSGKTFLIESIIAALFGRFAWYGAAYDAMSIHGTGDARIDYEFLVDDTIYTARRRFAITPKTRRSQAWLFRGDTQVAGPKASDTNAEIEKLCGTFDQFMSTSFLAQNQMLDLIGEPGTPSQASRRRDVFGELLHVSYLTEIANRLGGVGRDLDARRSEADARLSGMAVVSGDDLAAAQQAVVGAKNNELAARTARDAAAVALDAAATDAQTASTSASHAKSLYASRDAAMATCQSLEREQTALRERERRIAEVLSTSDSVTAALQKREQLLGERERLRGQAAARAAYVDTINRRDTHADAVQRITADLERMASLPGASPETIALAGTASHARDVLATQEHELAQARRDLSAVQSDHVRYQSSLSAAQTSLADLRNRAAAVPVTPGGDLCETCPLLAEYSALPDMIAAASALVERNAADVTRVVEVAQAHETNITHLAEQIERQKGVVGAASVAETQVKSAEATLAAISAGEVRLRTARTALNEYEAAIKDTCVVADPTEDIERVQAELDTLGNAPERQRAVEAARAEQTTLGPRLDATAALVEQSQRAVSMANDQCRDIDLGALDSRATQAVTALAAAKATLAEASMPIDGLIRETADAEHHVRRLIERVHDRDAQQARYDELTEQAAGCADLRVCFGPHGVRQLLIDQAAPELEAVANDLLRAATHGDMTLRIATQKTNLDGSIAECFDLLVSDAKGERDVSRYSGGEGHFLRILFRLAVAQWSSHKQAQSPQILVVDEAFDKLGSNGTAKLLSALAGLGETNKTVLLITHDDAIAQHMPSRLRVETNGYMATVIAE